MKDQITALMEALRLVGVQVDRFIQEQQGRDETLAAIETILRDPRVAEVEQNIRSRIEAPSIVPDARIPHI